MNLFSVLGELFPPALLDFAAFPIIRSISTRSAGARERCTQRTSEEEKRWRGGCQDSDRRDRDNAKKRTTTTREKERKEPL
jgi:hypothetical protein